MSRGQRHIATILHLPVLAVAAAARAREKDEKKEGG